jgi:hypothetical protein
MARSHVHPFNACFRVAGKEKNTQGAALHPQGTRPLTLFGFAFCECKTGWLERQKYHDEAHK